MADTAKVFEPDVDYRKKFIDKYGRKTDIPSVTFLDAKFHPTMADHVIVLSSVTMPTKTKINTLLPVELLEDIEDEVQEHYYNKAKNEYMREHRTVGTAIPKPPMDIDDPSMGGINFEGGSSAEDEVPSEGLNTGPLGPRSSADDLSPASENAVGLSSVKEEESSEAEESSEQEGYNESEESEDEQEAEAEEDEEEAEGEGESSEESIAASITVTAKESEPEQSLFFSQLDPNPEEIEDSEEIREEEIKLEPNDQRMVTLDMGGTTMTQKKPRKDEIKKGFFKKGFSFSSKHRAQIKQEEQPKFYRKKTSLNKKVPKQVQDENSIIERAVEMYVKEKFTLFEYQEKNPLMLRNDDESEDSEEVEQVHVFEPDERSKLITTEFEEPMSDGQTFSRMPHLNNYMNVPSAFKNSYQLSLWKIDDFTVTKIENKYFTPKTKRANMFRFPGFKLQLSIDEQTMLMIEKDQEKEDDFIVISFDIYTLNIMSELLVSIVDETIRNEPYYQGPASELNMYSNGPCQIGDQVLRVNSWNFGNYILAGVSTTYKSRIIYKFRVYNTKTSALMSTIVRGGNKLLSRKIISLCHDDENVDILQMATMHKNKIIMLDVNMMTGDVVETARYSGFNPSFVYPSADQNTLYLINQDFKTQKYSLY